MVNTYPVAQQYTAQQSWNYNYKVYFVFTPKAIPPKSGKKKVHIEEVFGASHKKEEVLAVAGQIPSQKRSNSKIQMSSNSQWI